MAEAVAGVGQSRSEGSGGVQFSASLFRQILILLVCASMTVFAGAMALGFVRSQVSVDVVMSYLGLPIFGLCTVFFLKQTISLRGTVLEVGPQGILDRRLSETRIPWSAITRVSSSSYSYGGIRFVMLQLDPAFEAKMDRSRFFRCGKRIDELFGSSSYFIDAVVLNGSFRDVEMAVEKFWALSKERVGSHSSPQATAT